jgi:uncharacterized protein YlxW (UPF0749 family)
MDHNILDAPDAQVTLDAVVLGNTGWTLRKLLHRNATDPEPGARRRAATRALVELFIEQRMENNRLGSELAQARRDHNAALSRYETEASRAASLEAERDRAQQAAQAAQAKVATLTTQVAELTASKESALAKLAKEREAPTDLRDTSFRRLSDITIVGEDGPTAWNLQMLLDNAIANIPRPTDTGVLRLFPTWAVSFACREVESLEATRVRLVGKVSELMFANETLRGDVNRLATEVSNLRSMLEDADAKIEQEQELRLARDGDRAQIAMLHEKIDVLTREKQGLLRENEALLAAGAALERERTPVATVEPKRAPIEPWGLVRDDDDDEQGKPIPVWPDAFPMKLITDRAVPEGEVLMITDEQVAEPITQEQLDAARQYARAHAEWFVRENPPKLPPEPRLVDPPKLSFAPESRPTYEHEVTGWLSETEFRTKLRTAGEHGWKLVSHTMDLTDNTHFCVFGRRA